MKKISFDITINNINSIADFVVKTLFYIGIAVFIISIPLIEKIISIYIVLGVWSVALILNFIFSKKENGVINFLNYCIVLNSHQIRYDKILKLKFIYLGYEGFHTSLKNISNGDMNQLILYLKDGSSIKLQVFLVSKLEKQQLCNCLDSLPVQVESKNTKNKWSLPNILGLNE
ncbi:hypothetical protein [Sediminitomix flava]|uniref:Uncharacterized protein n=1 Tax=Sediminitomix flava TaxID=379075 RepID=A0A315Z6R6_SEDFL|nr:hypothetical protein [Sediminitomix flava]PWJ38660.1 hypothetical protein BC781_107251 [Sediminitomix flava]